MSNPLQQQLFEPGPAPEPHPGDLHHSDWLQRPDVVYHATSNPRNFADQPVAHYGDLGTAMSVARDIASSHTSNQKSNLTTFDYIEDSDNESMRIDKRENEWGDEDVSGIESGTHSAVYARRMNSVSSTQFDDRTANKAHIAYAMGHEDSVEISGSVAGSVPDSFKVSTGDGQALSELQNKGAIPYKNLWERPEGASTNNTVVSHLSTSHNSRSYWHDVADSPNRSEYTRSMARSMIESGNIDQPVASIPNGRHKYAADRPNLPLKYGEGSLPPEYPKRSYPRTNADSLHGDESLRIPLGRRS